MADAADKRAPCWAVLRDWYEGGAASYRKLALASCIGQATIRNRALREGWKKRSKGRPQAQATQPDAALVPGGELAPNEDLALPAQGDADPEARLARVTDFILREVESLGAAAQRQGFAPTRARVDAVLAMMRVLEKVEGMARERAGAMRAKVNEEAGDVLRRIDGRIEELARAYAEELARAYAGELCRERGCGLGGGSAERG